MHGISFVITEELEDEAVGENYDLIGGPSAGCTEIDGPAPKEIAVHIVEDDGKQRGRAAFYRLDETSDPERYHFSHLGQRAVLRGGIYDGWEEAVVDSPQTIEKPRTWHEKTADVCVYELAGEDEAGSLIYEFREFTDYLTLEERSIAAVEAFYKKPNYDIYSLKPGFHKEVWIEAGHRRASVDEGMVEVIQGIWRHDWETLGSCQERPPGSEHTGKAYVDFPARSHALAFAELLKSHNIEFEIVEKIGKRSMPDVNGKIFRELETPSANILFSPKDIERVVAALNAAD